MAVARDIGIAQTPPITTQPFAHRAPAVTGAVLGLLTIAMALSAWYIPPGVNWLVVLAIITVFFLVTGRTITGRALGVLINERNLMSLSRLQLVIWTAIIVSGFFVVAIERIHSGEVAQPLAIGIDWQVWALLGLSAGSFVGTPLLYDSKKSKEPRQDESILERTASHFAETAEEVDRHRQGVLYGNASIADARFTDMFEGDELTNTHLVDIAKLQMFFFTVVVAIAYGFQLFELIAYGDLDLDGVHLPELKDGLLALMGVSHGAYLGSKGVSRTPTQG